MSSGEELFIWDGWVMRSDICIVINSNRLLTATATTSSSSCHDVKHLTSKPYPLSNYHTGPPRPAPAVARAMSLVVCTGL
jgi:hypothetical protein